MKLSGAAASEEGTCCRADESYMVVAVAADAASLCRPLGTCYLNATSISALPRTPRPPVLTEGKSGAVMGCAAVQTI